MPQIGVVGDYRPTNPTHLATTEGLEHTGRALGLDTTVTWLGTDAFTGSDVEAMDGLLVAPGSPYASMTRALDAIRFAREHDVPLLGTCGGFQHLILEFARDVLGVEDADHAEYDPYASTLFITALTCSLRGQQLDVQVHADTRAGAAYQASTATERYYCDFGLNPAYLEPLRAAGLVVSGVDKDGEVRIVELPARRFFVGTLFVPQASSTPERPHPLLTAFLTATR
jgi:CTP synthase (UTP-ammonia lyase)